MKGKWIIGVMVLCFIVLHPLIEVYAFMSREAIQQSSAISESLEATTDDTVELEASKNRLMIDDFEDGDFTNLLDCNAGAWSSDPNSIDTMCDAAVVDILAPDLSTKALRLSFDINSEEYSSCGYWMKLGDFDATVYDRLEFYVKGDPVEGFPQAFQLEFKQPIQDKPGETLVGKHTVENITPTWQRVSVPLGKFNALRDWKNLDEFVIIFHARLGGVTKGVVYIDSIRFVKDEFVKPRAQDSLWATIPKTEFGPDDIEFTEWLAARLKGVPEIVHNNKEFPLDDKEFLLEIARDTWRYFDEIIDTKTHLPLDHIILTEEGLVSKGGRIADYTNITNIGIYLMAIVSAYDLGFIAREDALGRIVQTLDAIDRLETWNNFPYNYYDTTTVERTSNFISLIDSGWLASGMYVVKNAFPGEFKTRCERMLSALDFSLFYDETTQQLYHGYFSNIDSYSNYHYGAFYTEPRIISYLAIARGDISDEHWFKLDRTLPETYTWQSSEPINRVKKMHKDISYYGGYYEYKGKKFVPSWGGSLFEALMPTLLLKEKELSPESLGHNAKMHSEIHVAFAKEELGYDVWGMSPCSVPGDGYSEYGVKPLGLKGYKPGVITPHVSFLTLDYIPEEAINNIRTMIEKYNVYGEYGFYDALDPKTGDVALKYLCLDQGMILLALDNYLNNGAIRNYFHADPAVKAGEYLLREENLFES